MNPNQINRPKLQRQHYVVLMDDGTDAGEQHEFVVRHADMIAAERQAKARKVDPEAHFELGSLIAYCAMKRLQLTAKPYGEWVDDVLIAEPAKDEHGKPELVDVDPTSAPSDSL